MNARTCGFCSDGFQPVRSSARFCSRKCSRAQYYQDNKEHIAERNAQYYQDNKEHIAEYMAQARDQLRHPKPYTPVTSQGEWTGD